MKTIRTYSQLVPAQLAQSRLRAIGIEAIIADESSASLGYGSVLGGIRLQVEEKDLDLALAELEDD